LPHVESGLFTFIGATTENPSFEVNSALLSRAAVYVLKSLSEEDLSQLVDRALGLDNTATIDDEAKGMLVASADGDGRKLLNNTEIVLRAATQAKQPGINTELLKQTLGDALRRFDKGGDAFYDQISALHKSVRGSNPDGALYWLVRMLDGGADPRYLSRRLIRMASEDIGLADPRALRLTLDAAETYERLGSPEGELAIAQAVVYLGTAPKSNALYTALGAAQRAAKGTGSLMPPAHILNAPTKLMKNLGYGAGYAYDHDSEEGFSGQNYFPDTMPRQQFYHPVERGFEREVGKRLAYWAKLRQDRGA
jgi:putative ATPase